MSNPPPPTPTPPPPTPGSTPALLLNHTTTPTPTPTTTTVEIHPLVLLSILDHHTRRSDPTGRVIGSLLGNRSHNSKTIEITNSFAVPHAERGDEVAIGKDFNRQMLALHLRGNKKETVVGWYATALPSEEKNGMKCVVADTSSLIHEFYAGECEDDPIHLVVDTSFVRDTIAIKAYKSTPVQVKTEPLANLFHEIRLVMKSSDGEKICLHQMIASSTSSQQQPPQPQQQSEDEVKELNTSFEKLYEMLETASEYVDQVLEGKKPADDALGRRIADTLNAVPRMRREVFEDMFNDTLQDLLMVAYLTNITRTQLTIAEKLNASLGV